MFSPADISRTRMRKKSFLSGAIGSTISEFTFGCLKSKGDRANSAGKLRLASPRETRRRAARSSRREIRVSILKPGVSIMNRRSSFYSPSRSRRGTLVRVSRVGRWNAIFAKYNRPRGSRVTQATRARDRVGKENTRTSRRT